MIRLLKGIVESCDDEGVILDVNGIGFFVYMPKIMLTEIQKGQVLTLHVYMCIKPEQQTLYGFLDVSMRAWFLLLLSVQGVGPKTALNILSTLPLDSIIQAITFQDSAPFLKVSGLGKKSASRLLHDLKDKSLPLSSHQPNTVPHICRDAVLALTALGFNEERILPLMKKLMKTNPFSKTEDIVSFVLKNIS